MFPYHYGSYATRKMGHLVDTDCSVSIPLWFLRNVVCNTKNYGGVCSFHTTMVLTQPIIMWKDKKLPEESFHTTMVLTQPKKPQNIVFNPSSFHTTMVLTQLDCVLTSLVIAGCFHTTMVLTQRRKGIYDCEGGIGFHTTMVLTQRKASQKSISMTA